MANESKKTDKGVKPAKKSFSSLLSSARKSIRITWYVSIVTLFCIVAVGGLTGRFAIWNLNESKLKDTWAILFLEMENVAENISVGLVKIGDRYSSPRFREIPKHTFSYNGNATAPLRSFKSIDGTSTVISPRMTVEDIGYDVKSPHLLQFASYKGDNFLVKRRAKTAVVGEPQTSNAEVFLDLIPVTIGRQIDRN